MIRSSVVLPEPDGPSRGDQFAVGHVQTYVAQRGKLAERLGDVADLDAHAAPSNCYA